MEIEIKQIQKESNYKELPKRELPVLYLTDNKITLSEVVDEVITSQVITLEPKDILKLMTWYMGQEEHKRRELISLRKIVEEMSDPKKLSENLGLPESLRNSPRTDKDRENQKIIDNLLKLYKINELTLKSMPANQIMDAILIKEYPELIVEQKFIRKILDKTGKDIKDL